LNQHEDRRNILDNEAVKYLLDKYRDEIQVQENARRRELKERRDQND